MGILRLYHFLSLVTPFFFCLPCSFLSHGSIHPLLFLLADLLLFRNFTSLLFSLTNPLLFLLMRSLFLSESKRALTKGAVHTTDGGPAQGGAIWMAPGQWKTGGFELLGQIPLYPPVMQGGDQGAPIVVSDRESSAARALTSIAARIVERMGRAEGGAAPKP